MKTYRRNTKVNKSGKIQSTQILRVGPRFLDQNRTYKMHRFQIIFQYIQIHSKAKVGKLKEEQIANIMEKDGKTETNYKIKTMMQQIQQKIREKKKYNRRWIRLEEIDYPHLANLVSMKIPEFKEENKNEIHKRKEENKKKKV